MIYDDLLQAVKDQAQMIDDMKYQIARMCVDVYNLEKRLQLIEGAMTDEEITVEDAARRVV